MTKKLSVAMLYMLPIIANAQFGSIMNKVKNKVELRADNKLDKAIDKNLDKADGIKQKDADDGSDKNEDITIAGADKKKSIKSYSKFDFVAGEKILFAEDFAKDNIGELPANWNSSGKGEVMTIENKAGKWLRGFQRNTYLTGNKAVFGENFTIEFDLMYYFEAKNPGYLLPHLFFGMFASGDKDNGDNVFLKSQEELNSLEVTIVAGINAASVIRSHEDRKETFQSDRIKLPAALQTFNQPVHYSIQVQKQRLRMWVNETKVFDIPRAVNTRDTLNQLYFKMESYNYQDEEIGFYLNNIKVATGVPDTRHKLIEEGSFSTTGILFDENSASVKPESSGIMKEIAGVLKENKTVKITVTGHTSSDGDDSVNLELSKKRALTVKDALVNEFDIEAARIETGGKGETMPVADNKTKEGRAANRRVEFIKQK